MSQSPTTAIFSPMGGSGTNSGAISPNQTVGHGFFNENNARRWDKTRKSLISQRYENELKTRINEEKERKRIDKILKDR